MLHTVPKTEVGVICTKKFFVNFKPKHPHPRYQASTDRGVTVSVMAINSRSAIAEAKRQGVHALGDYPGTKSFDWYAEAV